MGLIELLIIGAIIGWLAASIAGRREGIFGSMAIGVVGAFIGGFLSSVFTGIHKTFVSLTWSGVLWTFVGALVLSILLNALHHNRNRATNK